MKPSTFPASMSDPMVTATRHKLLEIIEFSGSEISHEDVASEAFEVDVETSGTGEVSGSIHQGQQVHGSAIHPSEGHASAYLSGVFQNEVLQRNWMEPLVRASRGETKATERTTTFQAICHTCKGAGECNCGACAGHGFVGCTNYQCSNGKVPCGCGNGRVKCSGCGGIGKISTTEGGVYKQRNCAACYGSGYSGTCWTCSGMAQVTCGTCNGTSRLTCRTCSGSGDVPCKTCGTKGQITKEAHLVVTTRHIRKLSGPDKETADIVVNKFPGGETQLMRSSKENLSVHWSPGETTGSYDYKTRLCFVRGTHKPSGKMIGALAHREAAPFVLPAMYDLCRERALRDVEGANLSGLKTYPLGRSLFDMVSSGSLAPEVASKYDHDEKLRSGLKDIRRDVILKVTEGESALRAKGYAVALILTLLFTTIYAFELMSITGWDDLYAGVTGGRLLFPDLRFAVFFGATYYAGPYLSRVIEKRRARRAQNLLGEPVNQPHPSTGKHYIKVLALQLLLLIGIGYGARTPLIMHCPPVDEYVAPWHCAAITPLLLAYPLLSVLDPGMKLDAQEFEAMVFKEDISMF